MGVVWLWLGFIFAPTGRRRRRHSLTPSLYFNAPWAKVILRVADFVCKSFDSHRPDLPIINYLHTLCIETDASTFGMGASLSQNLARNGEAWKNILQFYIVMIRTSVV